MSTIRKEQWLLRRILLTCIAKFWSSECWCFSTYNFLLREYEGDPLVAEVVILSRRDSQLEIACFKSVNAKQSWQIQNGSAHFSLDWYSYSTGNEWLVVSQALLLCIALLTPEISNIALQDTVEMLVFESRNWCNINHQLGQKTLQ